MWHVLIPLILIINIKIVQVYCENSDYNNLICDDFYKYACSDWIRTSSKPHSEPYWNIYTETAQRISNTLENILENETFVNIENEKLLYKSCTQPGADYIIQFRYLINKLGGIQRLLNNNVNYDFLIHIIEITKLLNIHPILKFHVANDRMLHIDRGDFIFPEMFLTQSQRYHEELQVYKNWIEKSLSLLLQFDEFKDDRHNIFAAILRGSWQQISAVPVGVAILAKEIVEFEVQLAKLPSGKVTKTKLTNKIKYLLKFLFENIPYNNVNEVHINEIYFDSLASLINKTNWRIISNYIIWTSIKELSRDVNSEFRHLSFEVDKELLGITADLSREKECVDQVVKHLGHEKLLKNFQLLTGQDEKMIIVQVHAMAADIKNIFLERLEKNGWLTTEAKNNIMNKVQKVRFEILRPVKQDEHNEILLGNVGRSRRVKLESNHLINLLKLKSRQFQEILGKLLVVSAEFPVADGDVQWPSNIFDVNAFYSPSQNAIILPMGILQPPFFHTSQQSALNYGALGSLIGHELSHALDDLNLSNNFTRLDFKSYDRRRNCIKNIFDSFGIDQGLTLNENIADFIGIRMSYLAMARNYANDVREQGNSELFFLSYAKMWCELSNKENDGKQMLIQDEHAPVGIRVDGTLQNFPIFLKTFNCLRKQPLNYESRCTLW